MEPTPELIDDLFRREVLKARRTPPEEKVLSGARLFAMACERMSAGLRSENPTADEPTIERLLRDRLAILRRLERADGRQ